LYNITIPNTKTRSTNQFLCKKLDVFNIKTVIAGISHSGKIATIDGIANISNKTTAITETAIRIIGYINAFLIF
jgi:hypothetical protein